MLGPQDPGRKIAIMQHFNPRRHASMLVRSDEGLPPWLKAAEQQLALLEQSEQPYKTAATRIELLQNAVMRAKQETDCTPGMIAKLQYGLAAAYLEHLSAQRTQQMEEGAASV